MKFLVAVFLLLVASLGSNIHEEISTVQSRLLTEGPTLAVLDDFTKLISQLEKSNSSTNQLPQLYYKKSIVEIGLNREKDAIKDLRRSLELDGSFKPAESRLVDLLIEYGSFDDTLFTSLNDPELSNKITKYTLDYNDMLGSIKAKNYEKCAEIIETNLIPISPSNSALYHHHIECLKHTQITDDKDSKKIIHAYSKLQKLESVSNLENYAKLSKYLLFTDSNFNLAFTNIKQCLRIDNEFKDCVLLSKFFSRLKKFLESLEQYSIEVGHIYLQTESESPTIDFVDMENKVDFGYALKFLFEDKPAKSALRGLKGVSTNYDYLMHMVKEFKKDEALNHIKFEDDVTKLICEAYTNGKDLKAAANFCSKVDDEKFLPKRIPEIDKLISKKKYQELEALMKQFPINTRQTSMFQKRWKVIESHRQQQEQENQQRRQQQYQQQRQQQYHQQQQQQHRQARTTPKNDYYKVLDVPRDADDKTIKKGYRAQTLKYHPDKYKGDDLTPEQIEAKMQDINQAYEVLADPELRERYDRGDDPNDPTGGGGGAPFRQGSPFGGAHFAGGNPFGGGSPFGGNFQFNFGGFGGQGGQGSNTKFTFQKNFKKQRKT